MKFNNTIIKNVDEVPREERDRFKKHVRDNYVMFSLSFKDRMVEEVIESPELSGYSALSNIGGALGLYLGGSLIACCEIFEIVIRLIMLMCGKITIEK